MHSKIKGFAKTIFLIRAFEEMLLKLFEQGKLSGTTHTCIGQEAISVAAMANLLPSDHVFGSHRAHGHFIARGLPIEKLLAEIMGKKSGVCAGRGGSQHLCSGQFYTNGIQGGTVANATGIALGLKVRNDQSSIATVFFGDGTLGEGVVYEAMNMASLWSLPVLYVIENNQYAQSTPCSLGVSGKIIDRASAFGIKTDEITSNDVVVLDQVFHKAVQYVREERKPFVQIVNTYRLMAHSKGDDFRNPHEIDNAWKSEPTEELRRYLDADILLQIKQESYAEMEAIAYEVDQEISADAEEFMGISDVEMVNPGGYENSSGVSEDSTTYLASINSGIQKLLASSKSSFLIGEDLLDPYGGAFKASKGLSTKFPTQVYSTPISEAGLTGLSVGSCFVGCRPIVEIMFGDFSTLIVDQLVNHASKYNWMYNEQIDVPMVVRTPMGGRRGYGPTHSQSIEKLFFGIPGLTVVAPSLIHDPGVLLERASVELASPCLYIENKLLYSQRLGVPNFWKTIKITANRFPTVTLSQVDTIEAPILLVTYGGCVVDCLKAAEQLLISDELVANVVVPSLIYPIPIGDIIDSMRGTKLLVVIEEGEPGAGWGAELIARLVELHANKLPRILRIGGPSHPIPSSKYLELASIFDADTIANKIRKEMIR